MSRRALGERTEPEKEVDMATVPHVARAAERELVAG
jgi:hypothetical protein